MIAQVGPYSITRELGRGGMGVFKVDRMRRTRDQALYPVAPE